MNKIVLMKNVTSCHQRLFEEQKKLAASFIYIYIYIYICCLLFKFRFAKYLEKKINLNYQIVCNPRNAVLRRHSSIE